MASIEPANGLAVSASGFGGGIARGLNTYAMMKGPGRDSCWGFYVESILGNVNEEAKDDLQIHRAIFGKDWATIR